MKFKNLDLTKPVYLCAGCLYNILNKKTKKKFIGLSIKRDDVNNIKHNIYKRIDLPDNCVDIFHSEDVFEHIEKKDLVHIINEIYRILKPGGLLRLAMPDYNSDIYYNRSKKDKNGNLIFDKGGGGNYDPFLKKVINGGHVWFPDYNKTKELLDKTNFKNINYLHYYIDKKNFVLKDIDYSKGWIKRTPDNDKRVKNPRRPLSIVVDCYK